MSTDLKVTSLGEASSAQPNYRAWLLKVEDGSGAEFTMEVRIYCTAKPALEGELGRPLAQEEMEMIAACLAKEKAMSAFSIHLIPPEIRLTSREVAGIEAQLLLKRCGLISA